MPYRWTSNHPAETRELHLWPHQSLPPEGLAGFVGATFALILLPLYPLLGTVLLWALLPFLLVAVAALWWALQRSRRDAQLLEVLTIDGTTAQLVRHNPRSEAQYWKCNRYWVTVQMHEAGGPVPAYVTLRGAGREVEIGAFLSEEERRALHGELMRAFSRAD